MPDQSRFRPSQFKKKHLRCHQGQAVVEMVANIIIFGIMIGLVAGLSSYLFLEHSLLSAAREGARAGALHPGFGAGDVATAEAAVVDRVRAFMRNTCGQDLNDANSVINVIEPDPNDNDGDRSVGVSIEYQVANPVPIADFIMGLTGTDHANLRTLNMAAAAQMRYEE